MLDATQTLGIFAVCSAANTVLNDVEPGPALLRVPVTISLESRQGFSPRGPKFRGIPNVVLRLYGDMS